MFPYTLAVALVLAMAVLTLLLHNWLDALVCVVSFTLLGIVCAGFLQGFRSAVTTFLLALPVGASLLARFDELHNAHVIFIFFFVVVLGVLYFIRANDEYRSQAQQALAILAAREEDLRTVIEALPIGICFADHSGLLVECNQQTRHLFGDLTRLSIEEYGTIRMWTRETG